ncbi:MAG TPA: hypothetical protein EYP98_00580 [Planctomycetes bacterium]|nr:hypothetical protein [Planctomycetota bacterium]
MNTTKLLNSHTARRQGAGHHARAGLLAALLLVLPSCFTMTVWGFELHESKNASTGKQESVMQYDAETEWSWKLFGLRVLATPFTLGLDCLTAPLQAFLLWDDDDC